jgi:hypothetical protein
VRLVGLVFCRPEFPIAQEILPSLDYFHRKSGEHANFYFAGYGRKNLPEWKRGRSVQVAGFPDWRFNASVFDALRAEIEARTTWHYSGASDLILTNAIDQKDADYAEMDFTSAICINLEQLRDKRGFGLVGKLFEKIFRYAENYKGDDPTWGFSDKAGTRIVRSAIKNLFISVLPEAVRADAKGAFQFVVRDIKRR